jgi:hypothetical protein
MSNVESSDGEPYNPNKEYGYCTCAKNGCKKRIRYPMEERTWRPRYCKEHTEEVTALVMANGASKFEAYAETHIELRDIKLKTHQEILRGE